MRTIIKTIVPLFLILLSFATPLTQQQVDQSSVTIPVEITSYGGIILQARVNDSRPLSFYLDSGASSPFAINATKQNELRLKLNGRALHGGGAGPKRYEV